MQRSSRIAFNLNQDYVTLIRHIHIIFWKKSDSPQEEHAFC